MQAYEICYYQVTPIFCGSEVVKRPQWGWGLN